MPQPLDLVPRRLRTTLRRSVNRLGIEVTRDPYTHRLAHTLTNFNIKTVVDVGANEGQYSSGLRAAGYGGSLVSVEPLLEPFRRLERTSGSDPLWQVVQGALSDRPGIVTMNVAANSVSSSLLPILAEHTAADSSSRYVADEEVQATTVDLLFEEYDIDPRSTLLKIDVQGHESVVLDGAADVLHGLAAVQLELTLVPLYKGQTLMPEIVASMTDLGFATWLLEAGFSDPRTGRMLQCDGVFVRKSLL